MPKTVKKSIAKSRFELRLSHGEVQRLDAIAARLNITKSDVLRLALNPDFGRESTTQRPEIGVVAESLDAVNSRVAALDSSLKNIESLLDSALDLLIAMSRNSQSYNAQAVSEEPSGNPQNQSTPGLPTWQAWLLKNPKLNPVMSETQWHEFLRTRYEKEFGVPPVVPK